MNNNTHSNIPKCLPQHIAIIPDGNGRWSRQKKVTTDKGHRKGIQVIEAILDYCQEIGIPYASIYAFSSENWKRPEAEKIFLFRLIKEFFTKKIPKIIKKNARIKIIGDITKFDTSIQKLLRKSEEKSKHNDAFLIQIALSYGGRNEIIRACKKIITDVRDGFDPNLLNEESIKPYLDTGLTPDPDFLIRTGGVYRTSNFLLYQMSYTEYYFSNTLWPDFTVEEFKKCLIEFSERERRYGGRND